MKLYSFSVVHLAGHAEQLHQIVPLVNQVDGDAAAQCLVGAVHGTVVHAGPPVRQITRADDPGAVGVQGGQAVFQRQHHTAPPHGRGHVGLLPGGQIVG